MSQSAPIVVERSQTSFDYAPLPDGWQWMRLKDLGNIADGDWILTSDYATSGVRLIQVGDIGKGRFVGKSSRHITLERAKELNCTFLQARDILISRMPDPMGRACMMPVLGYPCITAVDVSIWRPNNDEADREYLTHYLNSSEWYARVSGLASGATRQRISRLNLEKLSVPLPPLSEQKRIAAILNEQVSAVERARAAAEAQLKAAKHLPAAYLRNVFDSSEAKQWTKEKLGNVAVISGGIQKTPERKPKNFHRPYLTVRNVQRGYLDLTELERFEITESELDRLRLMQGDILIVEGNGSLDHIGRNALFKGEVTDCIHQNHIIRVRLDKQMFLPEFVSRFLNSNSGKSQMIQKAMTTSGLYTLSAGKVAALEIPKPSMRRQREIVEILNEKIPTAENACEVIKDQLQTISTLPAALLWQAFTGKV